MSALGLLAQTWLVLIGGLGGEPRYTAMFNEHAHRLIEAGQGRLALPAARIIHLSELTTPKVSKDAIRTALVDVGEAAAPDATVVIFLFGHGSAVGGAARFHLPGPDLSGGEFATFLAALPTQEIIVINAASASGPWIEALAGPRRAIVTATRSAAERDETVFPLYFVEALASEVADGDRNGRTSLLEAFLYTRREVERHYDEARRLSTEHALLEDDGDGSGTLEPAADGDADGSRAAALYLDAGSPEVADPVLAALHARSDSLERAVAALRGERDTLTEEEYAARLERLLLELARVGREIRSKERAQP